MKHTAWWTILCRQSVGRRAIVAAIVAVLVLQPGAMALVVRAAGVQVDNDSPVILAAPTPPADALGPEQRNEEGGYAFRPVAAYELETYGRQVTMSLPEPGSDIGGGIFLGSGAVEEAQTLQTAIDSVLTNLEESGAGSISEPRDITVDGAPGLVVDFSGTEDGKKLMGRLVVAKPETQSGFDMFYMMGGASAERWQSEVDGLFEAVLASVKFFAPTVTDTPVPPTSVPQTPAPAVATSTPTAQTSTRPADGAVMVSVPAGEFLMGSPDGEGYAAEHPQHTVALDAFWIDRTEVTNKQFEQFVQATGHRTEAETGGGGWVFEGLSWYQVDGADWRHPEGPDSNISDRMEHPVVHVSWNDATAYCVWAGARLPTDAEWEKAARGTDGRTYPWGNDFDGTRLNFCDKNCELKWGDPSADDGYERTAPVGSYPAGASPYGALDMAGNVHEWVADWYAGDYYDRSPASNPRGPDTGDEKVLRGGSWYSGQDDARCAYRSGINPVPQFNYVGFRCAMGTSSQ